MTAGQEMQAREQLARQADEFARGIEPSPLDPSTATPELSGWNIPDKRVSALFQIAAATTTAIEDYKRENPTRPIDQVEKATLHIGQPPTFPELQQAQIRDLWQLSEGSTHLEHKDATVQSAVDFIERVVVPNMASYSKQGGAPDYRKYVFRQFKDGKGEAAFAEKEMTVVSGGPDQALYFIRELLTQSLPQGMPSDAYVEVDTRADDTDWDQVLRNCSAFHDQDKFINIIIQDGADLDDEVRRRLNELTGRGQIILTDMINRRFDSDKSLAMDATQAGLVLTVDDSNLARATGTSAVLGYHKLVSSIEGLHSQRTGMPSTTQQDLALYLSDPNVRKGLTDLSHRDIEALPGSSPFLRSLLLYMRSTAQVVDSGANSDRETERHTAFVDGLADHLERRYQAIYGEMFPGCENAVSNGGGRWGLFQTFEYLRERDKIDTVIVIPPRFRDKKGKVLSGGYWTFGNVAPGMEISALESCYNENGTLNEELLTQELQSLSRAGKRLVVVDHSGGHNPSGIVRSIAEKSVILKAIASHNASQGVNYDINLVDDAAYLDLVFSEVPEVDRKTYAKVANESGINVDIHTVLSGSKGPGQAGARYNTVYSKDGQLIGRIRERRKSQTLNSLGIVMAGALFDPNKYEARRRLLVDNVEERALRINDVLRELRRDIGGDYRLGGAFYPLVEDDWIAHGQTPIERTLQLAAHRCGVIPLAVMNGDPNVVRLAGGGNKSPEQLVREVLYFDRLERELASAA